MRPNLAQQAVIAGIGATEFSKNSGRSVLQLAAEASRAAIADAGLTPRDIDGSVTFAMDETEEPQLANTLGIPELRISTRTRGGGGGSCATIQHAAAAVASGHADAVLVYRAFNERSERRFGQPQPQVPHPDWDLYMPLGLDTPGKIYGLAFQRYMYRYGLTNADFGLYSVVARQWAATNPRAWFYERPITLADHQSSRWIVEPILRLLDCCQENDGGVALVVTRADRARDLPNPVRIAAAASTNLQNGHELFNYYHDDLSKLAETEALAKQLFGVTGYRPADMDLAMIYENFSPAVLLQLEALGFCKFGEARDFIRDGHIGPGGSLPVNPNGGHLGEAYIHGMNGIVEAVRQLRGAAANQIAGAERAIVSSGRSGLILEKL
jgi:acetyl-CoA acetyltransferase